MSQAKHTPGPWEWSDKYRTADSERNTWSLLGDGGYGILSCDGDENSPQSLGKSGEANARLIAAAPDLLEAAKLVIAWYEAEDDHSKADFYQRMDMCRTSEAALRAAIAKATGGE